MYRRFSHLITYCSLVLIPLFFQSCKTTEQVDMIISNADVYTVDKKLPKAQAIAITDGKIVAIGDTKDIEKLKGSDTELIDAKGAFVMPGFIEGHGHYSGLGYSLINLNFINSKSWEEIVSMVEKRVKEVKPGEWIIGRGWHQEKWDSIPFENIHNYPFHKGLSAISPDNPVVLFHASGHSLYANQSAMEKAGITKETSDPIGGAIVRNANGDAVGVFEERAMASFKQKLNEYEKSLNQAKLDSVWYSAIKLAEQECLKKGITSFQDAGSTYYELDKYEQLAKDEKLAVRLWVMARHSAKELQGQVGKYKRVNVGDNFYTCNAIKSEVDGALGAFGAWLLAPYSDKPGFLGQNTTDIYELKKIADIAIENDMQFCVHAIGDRANRVVLDIYEGVLNKSKKQDHRWRIEHAQHLDPKDIPRFATNKIIASMQGIHCTSDAPFVQKRLGAERSKIGAYAWRSLIDSGVVIANGTDTPVEDVNPLNSFYASVTRKRADNGFTFYPEQAMTRVEAIESYTLGNAFAAKEESFKGSLTIGKVADIVILDKNLVSCADDEILKTKILYTITDGKVRYKN